MLALGRTPQLHRPQLTVPYKKKLAISRARVPVMARDIAFSCPGIDLPAPPYGVLHTALGDGIYVCGRLTLSTGPGEAHPGEPDETTAPGADYLWKPKPSAAPTATTTTNRTGSSFIAINMVLVCGAARVR